MSSDGRILGDWLTSYTEFAENSEPPPLFKIWSGVSAICACLQRKCWTVWDRPVYPNMYIVLVGPSGCRKGTAMGPIMTLLVNLGIKMAAEAITREALIKVLKLSGVTDYEVTKDQTEPIMHASLTIFSQELSVFLNRNNEALLADLCDWYDCRDQWTYQTKNMGTDIIIGVWVNIFGATTPTFLQSSLPQNAIGGGLTSRMVLVYGDKKHKSCPCPFLSPEEKELFKELFRDLEDINQLRGEFKMTKDFLNTYSNWYMKSEEKPRFKDINFAGYNDRRATHLRKLSMVMSASRGDDMILTEMDFLNALTLLERTETRMPLALSGRGLLEKSNVLEDIIRLLSSKGTLTTSDIASRFYRDIDLDELNRMVRTMEKAGICSIAQMGKETVLTWKGEVE